MKSYPIAIELTVWFDLGLSQYEIALDETPTISVKKTDDVLHTKGLSPAEVDSLIASIESLQVPVADEIEENLAAKTTTSYELIVESAHFSLEYNWEATDSEKSTVFVSVEKLAALIERLGLISE
jgi:hypothetical protein